jgi:hypothetical protein
MKLPLFSERHAVLSAMNALYDDLVVACAGLIVADECPPAGSLVDGFSALWPLYNTRERVQPAFELRTTERINVGAYERASRLRGRYVLVATSRFDPVDIGYARDGVIGIRGARVYQRFAHVNV